MNLYWHVTITQKSQFTFGFTLGVAYSIGLVKRVITRPHNYNIIQMIFTHCPTNPLWSACSSHSSPPPLLETTDWFFSCLHSFTFIISFKNSCFFQSGEKSPHSTFGWWAPPPPFCFPWFLLREGTGPFVLCSFLSLRCCCWRPYLTTFFQHLLCFSVVCISCKKKKAHRVKILIRIFPFFARLLFGDVDFLLYHVMLGSLSLTRLRLISGFGCQRPDSGVCLWHNDFSRYLMIIT